MSDTYKIGGLKTIDHVLAYEVNPDYTTEQRTIGTGVTAQEIGLVYAIVTATGHIAPLAPGASDGTQTAVGVLLQRGEAGDMVPGIERGPAIVFEAGLIWPAGISAPNKATAVGQLAARNIIIR